MKRKLMSMVIALLPALIMFMIVSSSSTPTQAAPAAAGGIKLSQVYGGGGANTGAPAYKYDYVELFNASSSAVDISGWTVQYGSATGNFASSATNLYTFTTGTIIQPGKYLLIQLGAAGTAGPNLSPTPDFTTTNLSMSATSGKVALANISTSLGCGAIATPCTLPDIRIADLVGYGNVTATVEITAVNYPTPLDSTRGAVRKNNGCQDTDNNFNDFTVVVSPTLIPRNSSSPANLCFFEADLSVYKTGPSIATPGDALNYTIFLSNTGNITAISTVVTDTLPVGVNFVTYTTSLSNSFSPSGNDLIWELGDVLSQTNGLTISVQVTVPTSVSAGTVLTNTVTASTTATETLTSNNTASVTTTIRQADLAVTKSGPLVAMPGDQLTYTLNVSNIGYPGTADLIVTDTLPGYLTYVSDTTGVSPTVAAPGVYVWTLPGVTAGGAYPFYLVANLDSGAPLGTLTNTVDVATSSPEESLANNHSQWPTSVGGPDLVVVKQGPSTAAPGDVIPFTLTVTNIGSVPAANIWLTDTLPAQMSYISDSLGGFNGHNGQNYGWFTNTLAGGSGITITVLVTVAPTAHVHDVLVNSAQVSEAELDLNPTNNTLG